MPGIAIDEADAPRAQTREWLRGSLLEERSWPRAKGVAAIPDSPKHSLHSRQDFSHKLDDDDCTIRCRQSSLTGSILLESRSLGGPMRSSIISRPCTYCASGDVDGDQWRFAVRLLCRDGGQSVSAPRKKRLHRKSSLAQRIPDLNPVSRCWVHTKEPSTATMGQS